MSRRTRDIWLGIGVANGCVITLYALTSYIIKLKTGAEGMLDLV